MKIVSSWLDKRNRYTNQPTYHQDRFFRLQPTQIVLIGTQGLSPGWPVRLPVLASVPWVSVLSSPRAPWSHFLRKGSHLQGDCQGEVKVHTTHRPHGLLPSAHLKKPSLSLLLPLIYFLKFLSSVFFNVLIYSYLLLFSQEWILPVNLHLLLNILNDLKTNWARSRHRQN